jgi:hypothetical protein
MREEEGEMGSFGGGDFEGMALQVLAGTGVGGFGVLQELGSFGNGELKKARGKRQEARGNGRKM